MIIYHTGEAFKLKESNVLKVILKIVVAVLCALSLFFLYGSVNESKQLVKHLKQGNRDKMYEGYYSFYPDLKFWRETDKYPSEIQSIDLLLADLIGSWQKERDLKVMRYRTYRYAETAQLVVFTYYVPESYEIDWTGIVLEMEEGEWFQDGEECLIVLKGENYKVGDRIFVTDKNGNGHSIPVSGISKEPYLVKTESNRGIMLDDGFQQNSAWDTVFLLNPFCDLNPPTDIFDSMAGYGIYKTDDYLLWQQMKEYGVFQPIKFVDNTLNDINRMGLSRNYMDDVPVWMKLLDYFRVFHLWYILLFAVFYAGLIVMVYFMNQWNFAKKLWIYFLVGILAGKIAVAFKFNFISYIFQRVIVVVFFLILLIFDIIVKKNTVHGRSYIVEGWDETDIDI